MTYENSLISRATPLRGWNKHIWILTIIIFYKMFVVAIKKL